MNVNLQVDKLFTAEGMYVNMDLPSIPKEQEDRKKAACECTFRIDRTNRQIVVTGNRNLYQIVDSQYLSYNTFPAAKLDILRKGGEFKVLIPIPKEYDPQGRKVLFKDGQLHIFLPIFGKEDGDTDIM